MTGWVCPHQNRERCERLKKECFPAQKGCVLEGKLTMSSPEGVSDKEGSRRPRIKKSRRK